MTKHALYSPPSCLLLAILAINNAHGDEAIISGSCEPEAGAIDSIAINIHPIFDETNPDENNWLFRAINYLHIDTHARVIKNDLLFSEGDSFDEKLLEQSERILRTRRYLNNVSVRRQQICPPTVNVDIREVWTLVPELSFSHAGGNSNYGFGLHDSNFLGYGKTVNITHTSSAQRTGNLFEYSDPNSGISDSIISLQYANNSDGIAQEAAIIRPFIALDSTWSAGISYGKFDQEDSLYNAGNEVDRFAHSHSNDSLFYGVKLESSTRNSAHRILFGYDRWRDTFLATGTASETSTLVPNDREFNYPWVEYQHINDGYIKAYNIQQINRVEDINLGSEVRLRLGYASSAFKNYDKSTVFDGEIKKALSLSERQLILTAASATGYYLAGDFYNSLAKGKISYHWQNFNRGQFYVGVTAARGLHLFADLPLELGGDTGLRGYPARYQAGDHLRLISIEQRFFSEREWFSLFHLGAAVFYDEGRVWGESAIPQSQTTSLRDFGIGLRISGTRTGNREEGSHNIVHLDIASPLDGGKDIANIQWLVKVKKGF